MANLARVTLVLDALAESRCGLTVTELATRTRLPRSAVHRVLQSLERERYVVRSREPDRPGYVLGPALLKFGMNTHVRLIASTWPDLIALAREAQERVELAVFSGREVVVVDQIAAPSGLHDVTPVRKSFSLHASCTGKVLLAQLPDARVTELLPPRLDRFTDGTVTSRDALLAELAVVRRVGVAVDREEHNRGLAGRRWGLAGGRGGDAGSGVRREVRDRCARAAAGESGDRCGGRCGWVTAGRACVFGVLEPGRARRVGACCPAWTAPGTNGKC